MFLKTIGRTMYNAEEVFSVVLGSKPKEKENPFDVRVTLL